MVRIMKKDGNRLEGIGERIAVRLTLLEEALGMTPGDPEIYGNWIASKAPEPEVGEEEVGVIEGMDTVEDATTCFPRTEDGVPFCWDYQIKGFSVEDETEEGIDFVFFEDCGIAAYRDDMGRAVFEACAPVIGAGSVLVFMENWDEAEEKDPRIWRYTFDGEKMHVQDGRFVFD